MRLPESNNSLIGICDENDGPLVLCAETGTNSNVMESQWRVYGKPMEIYLNERKMTKPDRTNRRNPD